jgi:alpha-ketoglutarate-dependent taurine dioxygenase
MLKIVKATFTDNEFIPEDASLSELSDVQAKNGDGSTLAALWAQAVQSLPKERDKDSEANGALEALYRVGIKKASLGT